MTRLVEAPQGMVKRSLSNWQKGLLPVGLKPVLLLLLSLSSVSLAQDQWLGTLFIGDDQLSFGTR